MSEHANCSLLLRVSMSRRVMNRMAFVASTHPPNIDNKPTEESKQLKKINTPTPTDPLLKEKEKKKKKRNKNKKEPPVKQTLWWHLPGVEDAAGYTAICLPFALHLRTAVHAFSSVWLALVKIMQTETQNRMV